ncbi:MAG: helix-hairpin-helix domain-containing protein [Tannerellaceae bacterium]|nr:helix-hairpin-helix domain-containing protein [Tannerellaceae bacterium]
MNRVFISMFIYLLIACYHADSQVYSSVDNLSGILQELGMDDTEDDLFEEWYDKLSMLINHPLDINKASYEDLNQLPFLSDDQIKEIILYRQRYGEMVSLYELKNLQELDYATIHLFVSFVYIDENPVENSDISVHKLLKYGHNELVIRYNNTFQQKKGYRPPEEGEYEPNKRYLGQPFYYSVRYSYTYDNRIQIGIIAEKDPGEPFFKKGYKGYDYYSAHLVVKDINRLKTFIVGDYKVSFGQGLVISQDFTPGHTAMVT